jgi:signal transduction histidine kinase/CheY-like chemotaxis protein
MSKRSRWYPIDSGRAARPAGGAEPVRLRRAGGAIRARVLFAWLLPALLAAAGVLYFVAVQRSTEADLQQRLERRQQRSLEEFDAWMEGRVQQARQWADRADTRALVAALLALKEPTPEQLNSHPQQTAFRALFAVTQGRDNLQGYFIIEPGGLSLGSLGADNTGTPNLLWQEPEFMQQMLIRGAALSPLMTSDVMLFDAGAYLDGKPLTLFVGVPVYFDGPRPAAYFTIRIPVAGLLAQQGRARFGEGGVSFLADRHGRLHADRSWLNLDLAKHGLRSEPFRGRPSLFARDPGGNLLGEAVPPLPERSRQPLTRSVAGLQRGAGLSLEPYRDHRGVPVVGSWTWDDRLGLGVVTEIPADEAYAPVAAARQHLVSGVAVLALLGLGVLFVRLQRSSRTLHAALVTAEAASRAKGVFVANMSHEIRTPLNAVLGIAHLLGTTPLSSTQRNYLQMIGTAGEALLGILNDILDYAKVEAGKLELSNTEFSLLDTVDTLSSIMSVNAAPKDIELVIGIEPDVPARLVGDSHRLLQVLVNLTGNAIKFTRAGEVVLRVSRAPREGGAVWLRFEVRDTGIGIPADRQSQLFSAFMQADADVAREFGGSGLGLAICKRLVDLMQGEIGVESTEGQGSTFWFELPFAAGAEHTLETLPSAPVIRDVLVVDDNDIAREFVSKSVERLGWVAHPAASGAAALELFGAAGRFDVALIDWSMPQLDGLQTSAAMRALAHAHQPPIVIMVSAVGRDEVLGSPHAAAIDAVVDKPTTPSKVFDAVMEAHAKRRGGYAAQRSPYAPARAVMRLQGMRILLVEDNYINQQVARGLLAAEGASVTVVEHGAAAIEVIERRADRIDLVLMDVQMPVMDGLEATRQIRARQLTGAPIVAMSAGVTAEEQQRCREAGMDDFIAKPISAQAVVQTIRKFGIDVRSGPLNAGTEVPGAIDMDELGVALNGDRGTVQRLLLRFEQECDSTLASLEAVIAAGKADKAAYLLHALKGMAANMRATGLTACAGQLEAALRSDGIGALNDGFAALQAHVHAIKAMIGSRPAQ